MTTRDSVTLRADVYRPEGRGRFPVLLSRLPYDESLRRRPGDIDVFVERGYVVIMQDTRGPFASDGDAYDPLVCEAADGLPSHIISPVKEVADDRRQCHDHNSRGQG